MSPEQERQLSQSSIFKTTVIVNVSWVFTVLKSDRYKGMHGVIVLQNDYRQAISGRQPGKQSPVSREGE